MTLCIERPTLRYGPIHYHDVIMSAMASQITSLTIVYTTVYSGADQRKHQRSASLAFVGGIHRWPVNSSHKRPVTRKMFPFDDVVYRETYATYATALFTVFPVSAWPFTCACRAWGPRSWGLNITRGTRWPRPTTNPWTTLSTMCSRRGMFWRAGRDPGPRLNIKTVFSGMRIPMLK